MYGKFSVDSSFYQLLSSVLAQVSLARDNGLKNGPKIITKIFLFKARLTLAGPMYLSARGISASAE